MFRESKRNVPITLKFAVVLHFVLFLHKCCGKNTFCASSYDYTSLKFCESLRFFFQFKIFTAK